SFAFGVQVRTPASLKADGTVTATPPKVAPIEIAPAPGSIAVNLPLIVRAGARFIFMDGTFESGDLELDGTYEGWGAAQKDGPLITVPKLGAFENINTQIVHRYND